MHQQYSLLYCFSCVYVAHPHCRSPYDLARDDRLWVAGAYPTIGDAFANVQVAPEQLQEAINAIECLRGRAHVQKLLKKQLES